jgi:hypothetical protein
MSQAKKPRPRKPAPEYKIQHRVVRLRSSTPAEATTWPWPFGEENGPAWKARYAPQTLTQTDLFELASIADAYRTMITHPCRGVADTIHDLRRVLKAEIAAECNAPDEPTLTEPPR